jgi:hypothetical protein
MEYHRSDSFLGEERPAMALVGLSDLHFLFPSACTSFLVFEDYTVQTERHSTVHAHSDSGGLKSLQLHRELVAPCVNRVWDSHEEARGVHLPQPAVRTHRVTSVLPCSFRAGLPSLAQEQYCKGFRSQAVTCYVRWAPHL